MRRPRLKARTAIRVGIAMAVALSPLSAAAQSTAGFPPVTSPSPAPAPTPYTPPAPAPYPQQPAPYVAPRAPAPQQPAPYPQQPAPYVAPGAPAPYPQARPPAGYQPYPPQGYPQPYPVQPGYPPRAPYVPPAAVPPGYVPPGYVPPPVYPQPPPPPRDPLMDENQRYRQQLGAYRRGAAPPPPAPPTRTSYVRIAPRTRHYHDGFYFRFALGVGPGHSSDKADRILPCRVEGCIIPELPYEASGGRLSPVTELAIGYAPWPGIVIGLGAYTATIPSHTVQSNNPLTGEYAVRLSQLAIFGPLLDYYPSAAGGFHVQASPGVGTYVAGAATPTFGGPLAQAHSAAGFGFMLGVGYEWWIADQWSFGLLGRLVFASTSGSDNRGVSWEHTSYAPSVLMGLTFQ